MELDFHTFLPHTQTLHQLQSQCERLIFQKQSHIYSKTNVTLLGVRHWVSVVKENMSGHMVMAQRVFLF